MLSVFVPDEVLNKVYEYFYTEVKLTHVEVLIIYI